MRRPLVARELLGKAQTGLTVKDPNRWTCLATGLAKHNSNFIRKVYGIYLFIKSIKILGLTQDTIIV